MTSTPCGPDTNILIPGYPGDLAPDEMAYLRDALRRDPELRYRSGFTRGRKTFPEVALREIAMHGDAEVRGINVAIVRRHKRRMSPGQKPPSQRPARLPTPPFAGQPSLPSPPAVNAQDQGENTR